LIQEIISRNGLEFQVTEWNFIE